MKRQFVSVTAPGGICGWADRYPGEVLVYEKDKDLNNWTMEVYGNLYYLMSHYDNLPELIIFAHPDVLRHAPKFFERVEQIDTAEFLALGGRAECKPDGEPHHSGLNIDKTVKELGLTPQKTYIFTPGATFSIGKDKVRRHSKSFYEKAIEIAIRNRFMCGEQVYVFERLWGVIFDANWNYYDKKWGIKRSGQGREIYME